MEILSEQPVSLASVKSTVSTIKKRDKEPNFRVNRLEEYFNAFSNITTTTSNEIVKKVQGLDVPRLKEQHIFKIADLQPQTAEDLKVMLQGYTITVSNDNIKKIVDVVVKITEK